MQNSQSQVLELMNENDILKEKQKEFYGILNKKLNEISDECKFEREKRIIADNKARVFYSCNIFFIYQIKEFEEKILGLELTLKKNISMFKQEMARKDDEVDYLKKLKNPLTVSEFMKILSI